MLWNSATMYVIRSPCTLDLFSTTTGISFSSATPTHPFCRRVSFKQTKHTQDTHWLHVYVSDLLKQFGLQMQSMIWIAQTNQTTHVFFFLPKMSLIPRNSGLSAFFACWGRVFFSIFLWDFKRRVFFFNSQCFIGFFENFWNWI